MDAEPFKKVPRVNEFLAAVEPLLPAYRHQELTFVSLAAGNETAILSARLRLMVDEPVTSKRFATSKIRAAQGALKGLEVNPRAWLTQCAACDWITVGDHVLKLLPEPSTGYSAYYEHAPIDRNRSSPLPYAHRVIIEGRHSLQLGVSQNELIRELRIESYELLDELLRDFGLTPIQQTRFEIVADPVARFSASHLKGRRATVAVRLAHALPLDELRLTIRSDDAGSTPVRHSIKGHELTWSGENEFREGVYSFDLPRDAILRCALVYGDLQEEIRLLDPESLPNRRRQIVELADPGLERHWQLLTRPKVKEQNEDFEAAVPLLFFMLGCAPAYVSALSNMQDEPDTYSITPGGAVLVIESTVKIPDDVKISKLVSRAALLREKFSGSQGDAPPTVIAVLVTPFSSDELQATAKRAEEHNIVLLGRSDIETALKLTEIGADADVLLERWRQFAFLKGFSLGEVQNLDN